MQARQASNRLGLAAGKLGSHEAVLGPEKIDFVVDTVLVLPKRREMEEEGGFKMQNIKVPTIGNGLPGISRSPVQPTSDGVG